MKNLAPTITRQRLLIEGHFSIDINKSVITNYLQSVAKELTLRTYGSPIIFSPEGEGKPENQGYDAFIPLIDSGISMYVWSSEKFLSVVFYTCKTFDVEKALHYTQTFFAMTDCENQAF